MAVLRYPRIGALKLIETIRHAFALRLGPGSCSCVAKSEQYRRLARKTEDERARASLLHMAQVWCRLAEERVSEVDERQSAES
jgi:hypothetical protein